MKDDVDLVILSRADTDALYEMTQRAIDTAIRGADGFQLSVVVMEQVAGRIYKQARTVGARGKFNYNAFANRGAQMGHAPWIAVANNDLVFRSFWLAPLLAAGHPVVSPVDPNNPRQTTVQQPETGTVTGRHLSGWCFLIRRELWRDLGGFDERVEFWCSDDAVIQQLAAKGIRPMVVPGSVVEHLTSRTLRTIPHRDRDELTWAQVHTFNEAWGQTLGLGNPRYQAWKRNHDLWAARASHTDEHPGRA